MESQPYNPYAVPASQAGEIERIEFLRRTYLHLGGAVLAFALLVAALVRSELGARLTMTLIGTRWGWLAVLAGFMLVGGVARRWAESGTTTGMQYAGLAVYVVAQAILFTPLLFVAAHYSDPSVIPTAGILTLIVFGGMTAIALLSRRDFSFLGRALMLGGFGAMGLIVASILFGFTLGVGFCTAMVVLAAGYVLYDTSNILRHYPTHAHVAASLALFSSVALMFWYVLRLVLAFTSRE